MFVDSPGIENEIKKCKLSVDYTNGNFINMLNKLENLVDNDNNKCTYKIEYPHYNKLKKKKIN